MFRWLSLLLLPLLFVSGPARAQDDAWYLGLPLSQVSIESPAGLTDDENLQPLLRSEQGGDYSPADVRADLEMLHAVGDFAAVEAHVEEWVEMDEFGDPIPSLLLIYQVWPAPTLRRIRVTGNRALKSPEVLQIAGLRKGARFFQDEEQASLELRLLNAYVSAGFPDVEVEVFVLDAGDGGLDLEIVVEEGEPLLLEELTFVMDQELPQGRPWWGRRRQPGVVDLSQRQLRRLARRSGLREGRRYTDASSVDFQRAVSQSLSADSWSRSRVSALRLPSESGVHLSIAIDAGRQVVVDRQRFRQLPRAAALESLLGVGQERQFSRSWSEEAAGRVRKAMREDGYLDAEVTVDPNAETGEAGDSWRRVMVDARPGKRYRLARNGLLFEGNEALDDSTLADAMAQASPKVLGDKRATPAAVEGALDALADVYRSRGYLDAALSMASFDRSGRRIEVTVEVSEGQQTTLDNLRVMGSAPDLQERMSELIAPLVGAPLNPGAVQRLVRTLAEEHRALGYLGATAEVDTEVRGAAASVVIRVAPGEQRLLRNVVIRGLRHTQRLVVEREVAMEVGEPITPQALDATRQGLYETELFAAVRTDLSGDDPRARDLVITVQERPGITLESGVGVSTDEGIRAFTRATRRNLFGLGHSLQGLGQIGLGYVGETWLPDTTSPEWRAALRYEAPHLPGPDQRLIADVLLNEQNLEPTYRLRASGAGVGIADTLTDNLSVVGDYRVSWRRLEDVDPGALVIGDPWLDILGVDDPTEEVMSFPSDWRRQGGFGLLLLLDYRDDRFNPTRGSYLSLRVDAWDGMASSIRGGKALGTAGVILPLGRLSLQWSGQGGVGGMQGAGATLPVDERFRLGGARTLRGYPQDQVGPKNNVSNQSLPWPNALGDVSHYLERDDTERWVPTGGDAVVQASTELWLPFNLLGFDTSDATAAVLFWDAGNVYLLSPGVYADTQPCSYLDPLVQSGAAECSVFGAIEDDATREPSLRYSVGAGIRFPTPVGPLQLDVGLNPMYQEGGWTDERGEVPYRFHLSLGSL